MTTNQFKEKIDEMFPCHWEGDFRKDLVSKFKVYMDYVSTLSDISEKDKDRVQQLCDDLLNVLHLYYDGRKGLAFANFRTIMNGGKDSENPGLFNSIESYKIPVGKFFYRTRIRVFGREFTRKEMFHIPLNKRGIVSTQRYSSPGYPCLYLGSTVYSCWEEMRRPSFDELMYSAYEVRYDFKVFDMRIPQKNDYQKDKLHQTIYRIPLILACSVVVKTPTDVFKPEYIIPQLLVETIICNNKERIEQGQATTFPDTVWGVLYTSTHINDDFPYGIDYLQNIVLPVVNSENEQHYCNYLATLFKISRPLCYAYESLKENPSQISWAEIDEHQSREEQIRKQYQESKMGYLENRLKSSTFDVLPSICTDCEVIHLTSEGTPVKVKVRSSDGFTIKTE